MRDSRRVRGRQTIGYASQQLHNLAPSALLGAGPILQRAAVDKLRNQILPTLELVRIVDRKNVRMVQRRGHLRLALEAASRRHIGEIAGEKLDRHGTIELGIETSIDRAHAAL